MAEIEPLRPSPVRTGVLLLTIAAAASLILGACASSPLEPYAEDTPPLILVPASQAGVEHKRGRNPQR